jgi:hypothetical protein
VTAMLIPLKHSERIFVTLSVVIQELNRLTDYPTENLDLILHEYVKQRDRYLTGQSWLPSQIRTATDTATGELQQWLDSRAEQSSEARKHLDEWERELDDSA